MIDDLRERPVDTRTAWFGGGADGSTDVLPRMPFPVRALVWAFVTGPNSEMLRGAARRVLNARSHAGR